MTNKITTLIVGASYFGIGYAASHPDCLILESSQLLGSDFHLSCRPADIRAAGNKEAACDLGKLMKTYHVRENDKFDILKASPVIHKYLVTRKDIRILLDAVILSVQPCDCGYSVKYMTNSGISELIAGQILDTTPLCRTGAVRAVCTAKTLHVITLCRTSSFEKRLKAVCPDCRITDGMYPGEKTASFPFSSEESLPDACNKITELWKEAFPDGDEKILFIAQDFDYTCAPYAQKSGSIRWINEKFPNPLTAFVRGMEYRFETA